MVRRTLSLVTLRPIVQSRHQTLFQQFSVDAYRTLPFQGADRVRYAVIRRDAHTQMSDRLQRLGQEMLVLRFQYETGSMRGTTGTERADLPSLSVLYCERSRRQRRRPVPSRSRVAGSAMSCCNWP